MCEVCEFILLFLNFIMLYIVYELWKVLGYGEDIDLVLWL